VGGSTTVASDDFPGCAAVSIKKNAPQEKSLKIILICFMAVSFNTLLVWFFGFTPFE
jgi:hypothetical protein